MIWIGIGLIIVGMLLTAMGVYGESDGACIMGLISIAVGVMLLAIYFSEKAEINSFYKNYPIEKNYEFYKIYTEDNRQEYIINPEFSNGMIIVNDRIYKKYSGYKKLTREEAAGHYK